MIVPFGTLRYGKPKISRSFSTHESRLITLFTTSHGFNQSSPILGTAWKAPQRLHVAQEDLWTVEMLKPKWRVNIITIKLAQFCNPTAKGSNKVLRLLRFFGPAFSGHQSWAPEIETQQIRCWEYQKFYTSSDNL